MAEFEVGNRVRKVKGAYEFPSTVQAVFSNRAGDTRLVCESIQIPSLLMIYSPEQMEIVPRGDVAVARLLSQVEGKS